MICVLALSGCVSLDIGVAKVGVVCDKARFANGGIELDGTAYAHFTPMQGAKALFNMGEEGGGEDGD